MTTNFLLRAAVYLSILAVSSADNCFPWCSSNKQTWESKCTWEKLCAACPECDAVGQTAVAKQASSAAEAGAFANTSPVDATGQRRRRQTRNDDKQVVPTSITQSMEPSASPTARHLRRANSVADTTIVPTTVTTTTSIDTTAQTSPTSSVSSTPPATETTTTIDTVPAATTSVTSRTSQSTGNADINAQQQNVLTETSPIATSKDISTQQKATSTLPARTSAVSTTTVTYKIFTFTHLADETMWLIMVIVAGTSIMVTIAIVACINVIRVIHKWHTRGRKSDESKFEQVAHEVCDDISDGNVERGGHR